MLLKQLVSICIIASLAINATALELEENKHSASFCATETPEKCLSKDRNTRSIESPISNLVENLKSKLISEFESIYTWVSNGKQQENLIQCSEKNLVIKVLTATVSNLNKTRCFSKYSQKSLSSQDCEEKEITTSMAIKMCNGRNKCLIQMDKEFSAVCECSSNKYIDINFTCIKPTSTLIEHSILNVKNEGGVKRRKRRNANEMVNLRGGEERKGHGPRNRPPQERRERPDSKSNSQDHKSFYEAKAKSQRDQSMKEENKEVEKGKDGKASVTTTRHRDNSGRNRNNRGRNNNNNRGRGNFYDDYRFDSFFGGDYYGDYYYDDYYYGDYYYGGDYYNDYYYDDYYYDYYNDPFYYDYYGYGGYDYYGGYGGGYALGFAGGYY